MMVEIVITTDTDTCVDATLTTNKIMLGTICVQSSHGQGAASYKGDVSQARGRGVCSLGDGGDTPSGSV
jgi:hypothetical protein